MVAYIEFCSKINVSKFCELCKKLENSKEHYIHQASRVQFINTKHCNSKRAFEKTSELEKLAKLWQSKGNVFPLQLTLPLTRPHLTYNTMISLTEISFTNVGLFKTWSLKQ